MKKLGSNVPLRFHLFTCDRFNELCVDQNGLFGDPETPTGDPDEEIMEAIKDATIFPRVTKISDNIVFGVTGEGGDDDIGFFFYHKDDHYHEVDEIRQRAAGMDVIARCEFLDMMVEKVCARRQKNKQSF